MSFLDRRKATALLATVGVAVAACSSPAATSGPTSAPTAAPTAAATAAPTAAPTTAPTAAPTAAASSSAPSATAAASSAAPTAAATTAASGGTAPTADEIRSTNLKGICPDNVVIQTNWYPEVDHASVYELIGPGGTIDTQKLTYSGPLEKTGVNLEIRAGGPAIGYQQVSSIVYQDDSILLGQFYTDEQIQNSKDQPTISVFSSYEKNPQIWMWGNPDWNFTSTADIGKAGVKVLAFDGATYLDVFTAKGLLTKDQIDTSYKGDPARFVAENGAVVQQGFVTNEPYLYEHEVPAWNKPVKYVLVSDYPVYANSLGIRADKLDANRACLQKLVPVLQQAQIDYVANPAPIDQLLVDYATKANGAFTVSAGLAADASKKQVDLGLIANGTDGVLGSFDNARVQTLIDDVKPVFAAQNKPIKDGLTPQDVVTNEFLNPALKLQP